MSEQSLIDQANATPPTLHAVEAAPAVSGSKLTRMLRDCHDIGGIYSLTYSNAIVLTSDFAKARHGGIAQGQWLLAASVDPSTGAIDDEEVVFLRADAVTPLPNERELTSGRMAVVRDAHAQGRAYDDVIDVHTRAEHEMSAYSCSVVGVFYSDIEDPERVEFGAELDNVWSAAHYRVFLPSAKALSWIASFPKSNDAIRIGVVRFSATRRNAQKHGIDAAPVSVNVADFIARKSAVLGITRGGKMSPLTTRIPVPVSDRFPTGWATIGEIEVGDPVYAADGSITSVIGLSEIKTKPIHRVTLSDGQVVECGPDHLWTVSSGQSRILHSVRNNRNNAKAIARDAAAEKRVALAADIRNSAHIVTPGLHTTIADIARLTGLTVDRVRSAAKAYGIAEHLGWDGARLTVPVTKTMTCYRVADAWPILVARAIRNGEAVCDNPARPEDEWLPARTLVEAATGGAQSGKKVAQYDSALRSARVESKRAEVKVASQRTNTQVFPAAELLMAVADHVENHHMGSGNAHRIIPLEKVVSTEEMVAEVVTQYGGERNNWAIRAAAPIDGHHVDVPVDPYVLGAWLGDGHTNNGVLTAGTTLLCTDPETGETDQERMLSQIIAAGYDAHLLNDERGYLIGIGGLIPVLRQAGVFGSKHIPAPYLRASYAQRLALLQGLMDTDGSAMDSGKCELALSDERLATDALELIRSLGIKASRTIGDAFYRNEAGDAVECKKRHRIHFTTSTPIFRLPRKARRIEVTNDRRSVRNEWLYVTDIAVGEPVPMRCLSVAHPEAQYLTDGFVPTHNSNTIKTIAAATYEYAAASGSKIGQIIFDPQGEYAKVNDQDGTGLRLLGDGDAVRIYSATPTAGDPQEHPLRLNFYDLDLFEVAWDMVQGAMEGAEANYVRSFRSADMEEPDANDHRAQTHWSRGRMAFYGLLHRAGYKGRFANGASINFHMKDDTASAFNRDNQGLALQGGSGVYQVSTPEQAAAVVDWVNTMIGAWEKASKGTKEEDEEEASRLEALIEAWTRSDQFIAVADVFKYAKGRGIAGLRELRGFHDPSGRGDVSANVWEDMVNGRLVIIDLSIGSSTVTKVMSERLITALVSRASERFRSGSAPIPFQVIVEEAHNLFERGRNANDDPWVRMSKEAAKYRIGLVYATQEVTSVDQRILSNTQNWIITHFNSDVEIRELSKYYDFGSFGESIKRAEEAGYARIKTFSSPFIVPVQIARFDHAMVNRARVAAGLMPIAGRDDETPVIQAAPTKVRASAPKTSARQGARPTGRRTTPRIDNPSGLGSLGDGEF